MKKVKLYNGIAFYHVNNGYCDVIFVGKFPHLGYWTLTISADEDTVEAKLQSLFTDEQYATKGTSCTCDMADILIDVGKDTDISYDDIVYIMNCE